jgi:hypothetical protein
VTDDSGIEVIDESVWIYPKDYFYPVSFDGKGDFTNNNTVAVHHYDATWHEKGSRRELWITKKLPSVLGGGIKAGLRGLHMSKKLGKRVFRALNWRGRTFLSVHLKQRIRLIALQKNLESFRHDYIVLSQPEWLGVSHVAEEMLGGFVPLKETNYYTKKEIAGIAKIIVDTKKSLIIFNGLAKGWDRVIEKIKELDSGRMIKLIHHGAEARLAYSYEYWQFVKILSLGKRGLIDEIGFVKPGQGEFYKRKGYNATVILNSVVISDAGKYRNGERDKKNIKIGLYVSDGWVKNLYTQIAAASLVDGAKLDMVPLMPQMTDYAGRLDVELTGLETTIPREELLKRMAGNDLNLYATFVEGAPLIPLESMELGVPCITGNNHHYFINTPLEEYLVVKQPDNVMDIYSHIEKVLKNRAKIMRLYRKWKAEYDKKAQKSVKDFLRVKI